MAPVSDGLPPVLASSSFRTLTTRLAPNTRVALEDLTFTLEVCMLALQYKANKVHAPSGSHILSVCCGPGSACTLLAWYCCASMQTSSGRARSSSSTLMFGESLLVSVPKLDLASTGGSPSSTGAAVEQQWLWAALLLGRDQHRGAWPWRRCRCVQRHAHSNCHAAADSRIPLCACRASPAQTPQVLQDEKLAENSDRLGAILRQRLQDIPSKLVKSVGRASSNAGIWQGDLRAIIKPCAEAGVIWHGKGRFRWAAERSACARSSCYAARCADVAVASGTSPWESSFLRSLPLNVVYSVYTCLYFCCCWPGRCAARGCWTRW